MDAFRHPQVRGSTVLMRKSYVEEKHGPSGVERFEGRASPALREALARAALHDEWVDFGLFIEATELVDTLFGTGNLALAWDLGRFGAEHNIGFWKALVMRVVSPTVVLTIASSLWSHHYDTGSLVAERHGDGVRLRITDFLWPHRTHCLSIGGWIERTLELGRPKRVSVLEVACRTRGDESCDYELAWE